MSVFQLTGGGTYVQQPPAGAYIISFPTNGTIKNISGTAITVTYYLIGGGGGGGAGIDTEPAGGGGGGGGEIKSGQLTLLNGVSNTITIGTGGAGADPSTGDSNNGTNSSINDISSNGGSGCGGANQGYGASGANINGFGANSADVDPPTAAGNGSTLSGPISDVITTVFGAGGGGGAGISDPHLTPTAAGTGAGTGGNKNDSGTSGINPGSGGGGGGGVDSGSSSAGEGANGIAYFYYMPTQASSQVKKLYLVQPPTLFTNTPPRVINFSYTIGASPTLSLTVLKSSISTNYSIVRLNCFKIANGSQTYTNITTMPLASGSYSATVTLTPLTVSLNNLVKFELIRLQGFKNGKWYTIGYLKRRQYKIV